MLEWILSASFLILAIIVLRRIFKGKISRRLQYALWGLALLRLLVPVSLFSASFSPAAAVSEKIVTSDYAAPLLSPIKAGTGGGEASAPQASGAPAAARFDYGRAAMWVWYWGMGITAAVFLFTNFSFYMRLRRSRRKLDGDFPLRVYICHGLDSPCLLGGSIYITPEMAGDETKLRHVLAHEYTHYRHLDGLWSILRCAAVSLHWYNPLVWWAAGLSKRDGELACDEGAVKALGEDERLSYGRTLIELTVSAAPAKNILCCATTMADGKKAIKERIEMISKNPKHIIVTAIVVVLICALAAGCAFSGAKADPVEEPENSMNLTDPTDIRDDGSKIYYLPMTIEGVEEEVPAKLHVLGSASIIVPEEGWQKTEEADGTGVKFIPDANKDVCISIDRYRSTDVDSLVNTLGEKYGQPLPSEPSAYLQGVMGWSADSFSFDGSIVSLYAAQCYGDSYVLTLSYPDDAESREGWGTQLAIIGATISYPHAYSATGLKDDMTSWTLRELKVLIPTDGWEEITGGEDTNYLRFEPIGEDDIFIELRYYENTDLTQLNEYYDSIFKNNFDGSAIGLYNTGLSFAEDGNIYCVRASEYGGGCYAVEAGYPEGAGDTMENKIAGADGRCGEQIRGLTQAIDFPKE